MSAPMRTWCVNHPSHEAVARCRQCGTGVCKACAISGRGGQFCSQECAEKYGAFMDRAKEMGVSSKQGLGIMHRLSKMVGSLLVALVALLALGVVSVMFEIPVLADIAWTVRGWLGI